ncbi:MAG: ABC transporter ATP-binding protein [Gemmatimonadaceae bacterium]
MIQLRDIEFAYQRTRATLTVPALDVGAGLTLIVGPNGAGKSTLLRIIAGVERPARGTVSIAGADLWREEVEARRHLAFVPEYPELTPYATVVDVLRLVASLRGAPETAVVGALDRVGLFDAAGRTVRELSMGQRRRAMLATALVGNPRLVILDEPLETLDAEMRAFVRDWVFALRATSASVLVATHDFASFAPQVDAVIAVHDGKAQLHSASADASAPDLLAWLERLARGQT